MHSDQHALFLSMKMKDTSSLMIFKAWISVDAFSFSRRLEEVVFDCGCEIRWLQLWQQDGKAGLSGQQLNCTSGDRKILLQDMNISNCGESKIEQILCF